MAKTATRSVDLEPIDRLEEKMKLLVSLVERLANVARGTHRGALMGESPAELTRKQTQVGCRQDTAPE
jgi:hypothetical protein